MATNFDNEWNQMSRALGFNTNTANNRLGYGYDETHKNKLPQRGTRVQGPAQIQYDEQRRGAYVDPYSRDEHQPVNFNKPTANDIGPTIPMNRAAHPLPQR